MMHTLNHNWLNSHAIRKYPIDDAATGLDDAGLELLPGIILDLHITWPIDYGQFAFIGGITITKTMVSIVIMAATATDDSAAFTPLGAVSVVKPVTQVQYPVTAMAAGVGGFIALGDTAENTALRFSSVLQSRIASRAAAPYTALPVRSLRRYGRVDGLTNIVKILGGAGISVDTQTVLINGIAADGIMLQLQENIDNTAFSQYIGPCGGRPESGSCVVPGIESVGGVAPDCSGNIDILFRQLVVGNMPVCNPVNAGFVLDQGVGLDEVCAPRTALDRFEGQDLCEVSSVSLMSESSISSISEGESFSASSSSISSSVSEPDGPTGPDCGGDDYLTCFRYSVPPDWQVLEGIVTGYSGDGYYLNPHMPAVCLPDELTYAYGLVAASTITKNIAVYDCGEYYTIGRVYATDMIFSPASLGSPNAPNGGIVLNVRTAGATLQYLYVALDFSDNTLKLWRYTGATLVLIQYAALSGEILQPNEWYRLIVAVDYTADRSMLEILCNVARLGGSVTYPTLTVQVSPTVYGMPYGKCGIMSNRGHARFDWWRMANNSIPVDPGTCGELPLLDCFVAQTDELWVASLGNASHVTTTPNLDKPAGCIEAGDASGTFGIKTLVTNAVNLVLYICNSQPTVNKQYKTDMMFEAADGTSLLNGGIALNCHSENSPKKFLYVGLDFSDNTLKLWQVTEPALVELYSVDIVDEVLQTDVWYSLLVQVYELGTPPVLYITGIASRPSGGVSFPALTFAVPTAVYGTPGGHCGMAANRCRAVFSYWSMDEYAAVPEGECTPVPYTECFIAWLPPGWQILAGSAAPTARSNPYSPYPGCSPACAQLLSTSTRNLMLYDCGGYSTDAKFYRAHMLFPNGSEVVPMNGGILINVNNSGNAGYLVAGLDAGDNTVKLWRYNGSSLITLYSIAITEETIIPNLWYNVEVVVYGHDGSGDTNITVLVSRAITPDAYFPGFTVPVTAANYGTADGQSGIASNRSNVIFDHWSMGNFDG